VALIANSLFEITAPDGTTVGFAACEAEADQAIADHMAKAAGREFAGHSRLPTQDELSAWVKRAAPGYKVVRLA
jgi:hypothetical protein